MSETQLLQSMTECADEIEACGAGNEAAVVRKAKAEILKLTKQLETLRGSMAADDARLRDAGMRSDCYAGCDTPDAMADRISRLTSQVKDLTEALKDCTSAIGEWSRPTGANGMTSMPADHPLNVAARKARSVIEAEIKGK